MAIGATMVMIATILIATTTTTDQYALSLTPTALFEGLDMALGLCGARGTAPSIIW
jgi:hypothetical protein